MAMRDPELIEEVLREMKLGRTALRLIPDVTPERLELLLVTALAVGVNAPTLAHAVDKALEANSDE